MKHRIFSAVFILFTLFTTFGLSQNIIINEIYNSSASTDEWIELLVIQDGLDLRGWNVQDFTNGGGAGATLTFSNNSLWASLQSGTIIVIGQSGASFTEDTDLSDHVVMIKATNEHISAALYLQ